MLSTIAFGGRTVLLSTLRHATTPLTITRHSTNQLVQASKPNLVRVQEVPARFFSKSNGTMARQYGARADRAEPIKTTAERVGSMHDIGLLTVGAAGALGIGALCYYGVGMGNAEGALDRAVLWPQYVRDRIHSTYAHLGIGFGISTAAAFVTFKSPALMRIFANTSILGAIGTMAALVGSSMVVQSIQYEQGFGPKQLAWIGHCSLLGMVLAPLSMFGGPALIRAATYTVGIVGGLSALAVCAPSERFLVSAAPLSIGLGAIVASSIGSMFFSPASKIGLGLYGISLYGGLIVFSGMLLYDTQKTIKKAELHPAYSVAPYDPINNSLHIYMDIVNIFIRMLAIFGGGNQRRR